MRKNTMVSPLRNMNVASLLQYVRCVAGQNMAYRLKSHPTLQAPTFAERLMQPRLSFTGNRQLGIVTNKGQVFQQFPELKSIHYMPCAFYCAGSAGVLVTWLYAVCINWLINWLIDWLIDSVIHSFIYSFTDWWMDGWIDKLIDWLTGWLIYWLINWTQRVFHPIKWSLVHQAATPTGLKAKAETTETTT